MDLQRRRFLQLTGTIAAGMIIAPGCKNLSGKNEASTAIEGIKNFGLQLYTLREDMPKDPKGVLKQVASFGYKQIESYEGPQGMFWGLTPGEFKSYLNDLGMNAVASHCNIFDEHFDKKAAEAAEAGLTYLICPWVGPQESLDAYKKLADTFNEKGEISKKNGLKFAYHNHAYTFTKQEEQFPQDVLMENTGAGLVDYELDIYWVAAAGEDTEAWLKKYKDRFRLCHVKDRSKTPGEDDGKNSVVLGTGSIDWTKILKTAHDNGMQHYLVEQEWYEGTTPLDAVNANATFMKNLEV